MATVSLLGTPTFTTTSGTKTVTATPAVGDLIIIVTAHTGNTATTAPTDNQGGTYTEIASAVFSVSTAAMKFWARDSQISSAVSTIFTHAPGTTTGGGLAIIKVTGLNSSNVGAAVRVQWASQDNQGTATPAPVFASAPSSSNAIIGAVFNNSNPAGLTPRTNFTELTDVGYLSPATGLEIMSRNSGETATTQTWGSSSSSFCSIVVELDSTGASQSLTPSLFTNSQSFYGPTTHVTKALTPGLFNNTGSIYSATVHATKALTPGLFTNSQSFYGPAVSKYNTLTPALFDNNYGPETVTNGNFDTNTTGWTDANGNLSATVNSGVLRLTLTADATTGIFYQSVPTEVGRIYRVTANMTKGTSSSCVFRAGISVGDTTYANISAPTAVDFTFKARSATTYIQLIINFAIGTYSDFDNVSVKGLQVYAPTVGNVILHPSLYTNTVFTPFPNATVHYGNALQAPLLTNTQSFYSANVSRGLRPGLFTNSQSFYSGTITTGPVSLLPSLFTSSQSFYSPVVDIGALHPSLFTNAQAFYGPTVHAAYGLIPAVFTNTSTFQSPAITTRITLTASEFINIQSFYSPTVAGVPYHLTVEDLPKNYSEFISPEVSFRNPMTSSFNFQAGRRIHTTKRRKIPLRTPYN